jgi:hypothetical protein
MPRCGGEPTNREWMEMIDEWSRTPAEWVRFQADLVEQLTVRAKQTCDRARAAIDNARRVRAEVAAIRCAVTARRRRGPRSRAVPSYWIAHPTATAFISALYPAGVGQMLSIAEDWPAGRYVVREHHPNGFPTAGDDRPLGCAIKDQAGHIRIAPDPAWKRDEPYRGPGSPG